MNLVNKEQFAALFKIYFLHVRYECNVSYFTVKNEVKVPRIGFYLFLHG